METIGKIFIGVILIVLGIIISGFILMKFWGWFIVTSVSFSVGELTVTPNPLTFQTGVALAMFISILTRTKSTKNDTFMEIIGTWMGNILYIGLVYFIGWLTYIIIF